MLIFSIFSGPENLVTIFVLLQRHPRLEMRGAGRLATGQGRSNVFPSIRLGAAAQRDIFEAWTQAVIFGRAPLDREGALLVKLEHAFGRRAGPGTMLSSMVWLGDLEARGHRKAPLVSFRFRCIRF